MVPVVAVAAAVAALARSDDPTKADQPQASSQTIADRVPEEPVSRSLIGGRRAILQTLVAQGRAIEEAPAGKSGTIPDIGAVVVGRRYLTADLNVWTGPGEAYRLDTVLSAGGLVKVTGLVKGNWAQIVYQSKPRWVRASYLSQNKPAQETGATAGGVTEAPCPLGSAVEVGLTPDAIRVYRSVCARFPDVTSYGGVRPDGGEHSEGRALDIMVSSSALGDEIADWVRANAASLGASEVLWAQHIWTVERGSEGWRLFEDRGSVTANHNDHVHVTVYGSSGG
jgi:hypothetical protein